MTSQCSNFSDSYSAFNVSFDTHQPPQQHTLLHLSTSSYVLQGDLRALICQLGSKSEITFPLTNFFAALESSFTFYLAGESLRPRTFAMNAATPSAPLVLRPYQQRILAVAHTANCLVVLPTGSGKTLIAGTLVASLPKRSIFLVPTCLLVKQQATALRSIPGLTVFGAVIEYQGGSAPPPETFRCLVSTPSAFAALQCRTLNLAWTTFAAVVFDEVHHVLKKHPYRKLALALRQDDPHQSVRVCGLTASYTYGVGEAKSRASLNRLCAEMRFEKLECARPGELEASGYHAKVAEPEVVDSVDVAGDVPIGALPPAKRKPHLLLETFLNRMKNGTITPFAKRLVAVIRCMEAELAAEFAGYASPVKPNSQLKEWGAYAHNKSRKSAKFAGIREWYEALRVLVTSWEEAEDAVVYYLRLTGCDGGFEEDVGVAWGQSVLASKKLFWVYVPTAFPRFERLKSALIAKVSAVDHFRGILFVQQRVTTHILEHFVRSDRELTARLKTACVYAASTRATPTFKVSKTDVRDRIAAFSDGSVNLLIATNVAEEGMDIPAANCVIRFDAMLHTVSLVQGRGRARQENSSLVVLSERSDRPTSTLVRNEATQLELLQTLRPDANEESSLEAQRQAQESKETNAKGRLFTQNSNPTHIVN